MTSTGQLWKPDYECTYWPDTWFGISLTDCCIQHDLTASSIDLAVCVVNTAWWLWPLGVVMMIGTALARPYYDWRKRRNKK